MPVSCAPRPTLLQKVRVIIPPAEFQDPSGAWLLAIRPGHTLRELAGGSGGGEVGRERQGNKEQTESLITRHVHPREGPSQMISGVTPVFSTHYRFPKGRGVSCIIPLPSARCHWPSVIVADGVGTFC